MRLKVIALVGVLAAHSWGCKCSPDKPGPTTSTNQAEKAKKQPKTRASEQSDPGISHSVQLAGKDVAYAVHLPRSTAPDQALPTLIFLLDRGQLPERFPDRYNVIHGAQKLGYLLAIVSPSGGKRAHWGHGLCQAAAPAAAASSGAASVAVAPQLAASARPQPSAAIEAEGNDVSFVSSVIADMSKQYKVDASKITIIGVGEGAAMAHRLAAEIPSVSNATLFNPRAECAAPTAPVQPEKGCSVMIFEGPSPGKPQVGPSTAPPTWGRLAFEAWLAAGKCRADSAATDNKQGLSTTTQSCEGGRVVQYVFDPTGRKEWPDHLGNVFTMRAIHNFLSAPK